MGWLRYNHILHSSLSVNLCASVRLAEFFKNIPIDKKVSYA